MIKLAEQMRNVTVSASAIMTAEARGMREAGIDVISLPAGKPRLSNSAQTIEAASEGPVRE